MVFAGSLSLLALASLAIPVSGQRVLAVSVTKAPDAPLRRRAGGAYQLDIENRYDHGGYLAHVEMGTPPQSLALFVDTGSSDTWVFGADPGACPSGQCVSIFDARASSSYKALPGGRGRFNITYGDGSRVDGDWFTDRLKVGEAAAAVPSLQMGVATRSSPELRHGIMGLGFAANEAGSAPRYPNLMDQLHDRGIIGNKAFSLYLDDFHAASGRLLLGGVDRARYTGELVALPLAATQDGEYRHFAVVLAGLAVRAPNGTTTTAVPGGAGVAAVLDAGTTLSHLPAGAVDAVARTLGAVPTGDGTLVVGCGRRLADADAASAFDFRFGGPAGPVIRVPVDELVLDVLRPRIEAGSVPLPDGWPLAADETCLLGLVPAVEGSPAIVGQTILRSAYVVYDLANRQVAVAQARLNATGSDIVEWGSQAGASPATSAVTHVVTITQTDTGTTSAPGGIDDSAGDDEDWLPPTVTVTSTDGAAEATGMRAGNAAAPTLQALPCGALAVLALAAARVVLGGLVERV